MSNPIEFSNRVFYLTIIFLVAIVTYVGFQSYGIWKNDPLNYPREIYVEGTSKTTVVPDIARLTLGVTTEAKTSEEAVTENTKKMNAVMEVLKNAGIEEKDIKTIGYSLNPNYAYPENKAPVQSGFRLDQTLEVTIRDFNKIGDLIAATTKAGANTMGGVNFIVEDRDAAKSKARAEAIAKAKEKAELIAEQADLDLGKVINYSEYDSSPYPYDYGKGGYAESDVTMDMAVPPVAPNIQPGEQEITLTVNLTYRVK